MQLSCSFAYLWNHNIFMKLIITSLFLLGSVAAGFAQTTSGVAASPVSTAENIKGDLIALTETEYDFGKIPQGKPVTHDFVITNTGTKPIALDNVQASCGCTTPEWSKESINPGSSAKIKVGYNAAADGAFTKSITLSYNGDKTREILIKGEVWKTPEASAPENTALNNLKNQ